MMPARRHTDARCWTGCRRCAAAPKMCLGADHLVRVGGPAEVMFRPADADDLAAFMAAKPD